MYSVPFVALKPCGLSEFLKPKAEKPANACGAEGCRADAKDLVAVESEYAGRIEKNSAVVLDAGIAGAELIDHRWVEGMNLIDGQTPEGEGGGAVRSWLAAG